MTSPEAPYGPAGVTAPTSDPSQDPSPSEPALPPRRGRGITALVLSLIPVAVGLIFTVIAIVAGANDDTGWAILGWAILGGYVVVPLGILLGGVALGLGISAAVKNRGRGAGIAGAILGGVQLLLLFAVFGNFAFSGF
jgi:hypothetical protein